MPELLNTSQAWLLDQLKIRQHKNKFYSLRAFSRDLGLPPGRVSEILTGKRVITLGVGEKICQNLNLSQKESDHFLDRIATDLHTTNIRKLSKEIEALELVRKR